MNDGLNASCQNNNDVTWTYNQGVILGALTELYRITSDRTYLWRGELIADAAMSQLVHSGGILREPCETWDGGCTGDAVIFKAMFVQGLARLYNADRGNKPQYGTWLTNQANAVWASARDGSNGFGWRWNGPVGSVSYGSHVAGLMAVGEVALLNAGGETATVPRTDGTRYEAESASRTNVGTEATYGGFTGSGYVAGWGSDGQAVSFSVNAAASGTHALTFRFAGGAGDAYRHLVVNGVARAGRLLFTGTGSWGSYRTVSIGVPLNAGANTVTLAFNAAQGSSNFLNLDHAVVTPTGGTVVQPAVELARGKAVTASTVEAAGYEASRVVDGNTSTRWSSAFPDPQWIRVDLGATRAISHVRLSWEAAYGKAYQVQTSNDGTTWSTVYSTTTGDGGVDDLGVSASGRYVRVYGTARGTGYGYSLWELEVYGR